MMEGVEMASKYSWIQMLDDEEIDFIKKFILNSGSLKELGKSYSVTYPTVRLRLDRLIQKIKINDSVEKDSSIQLMKSLAIDEKIDINTAKVLIKEYRKEVENGEIVHIDSCFGNPCFFADSHMQKKQRKNWTVIAMCIFYYFFDCHCKHLENRQ